MMTPESAEKLEKYSDSGHYINRNSEYDRLVISDEPAVFEAEILQPQAERRIKSFWWWIKAFLWCLVIIIFALVFVKWGVPFLFEKVLHLFLQLF